MKLLWNSRLKITIFKMSDRYYSQLVSLSSLSFIPALSCRTQEEHLSCGVDQIRWQEARWSTHTADTLLNRYRPTVIHTAGMYTLSKTLSCSPRCFTSVWVFTVGGTHKSITYRHKLYSSHRVCGGFLFFFLIIFIFYKCWMETRGKWD